MASTETILRCRGECPPHLGAVPIVGAALTSVVSSQLNKVLNSLGLGSSDPVRDQQRIDRINAVYDEAMAGQPGAEECLYEMAQGVSSGPNDPRQCAVGSRVAADYAKAVWEEYQGRSALGELGMGLVGASPIPGRVLGAATSVAPWVLGGAAVLAVGLVIVSRRGRR